MSGAASQGCAPSAAELAVAEFVRVARNLVRIKHLAGRCLLLRRGIALRHTLDIGEKF